MRLPVRMPFPPTISHPLSRWRRMCQQLGATVSLVLFLDIMGASSYCSTVLKRRSWLWIEPNSPLKSSNTTSPQPVFKLMIPVSVTVYLFKKYAAVITVIRTIHCMVSVTVSCLAWKLFLVEDLSRRLLPLVLSYAHVGVCDNQVFIMHILCKK